MQYVKGFTHATHLFISSIVNRKSHKIAICSGFVQLLLLSNANHVFDTIPGTGIVVMTRNII